MRISSGRQSVGHGDHGVNHDPHDLSVSVSARVRDCRNHHHVYVGGDGEADQRNEDRDLPLRVGDPAVIRSASGYVPLIAERLPPVAIANFSRTTTGHFVVSNSQVVVANT